MQVLERHLSLERSRILPNHYKKKAKITPSNIIRVRNNLLKLINKTNSKFLRTYDLAITIFDTVISTIEFDVKEVEIYATASFMLASKTGKYYMTINELVYTSGNRITESRLAEVELEIFEVIGYNAYLPIGSYFIDLIVERLDIEVLDDTMNIARYYYYSSFTSSNFLPSVVASASLYLAFMNDNIDILDILSEMIDTTTENIRYIASRIISNRPIIQSLLNVEDVNSLYRESKFKPSSTRGIYRPIYRESIVEDMDIIVGDVIDEGTFSTVYEATVNGQVKALKRMIYEIEEKGIFKQDVVEISILKTVNNSNIIECSYININIVDDLTYSEIVLEFIETNLWKYVKESQLSQNIIKRYTLQLFNAVKYLNDLGIIHCDIKPANILVKGEDIKLTDFGASEIYCTDNNIKGTPVYTLWYRPIEILLGDEHYGFGADVWACGVVLAVMVTNRDILPGDSNIDQLYKTIKYLGTNRVKEYLSYLPEWKNSYPLWKGRNLKEFYQSDDELLLDLLEHTIDVPQERYSIEECVNHPWFL